MSTPTGNSFTTTYNGLSNVLKNEVAVSTPDSNSKTEIDKKWLALWDTGATNTVITKSVIDFLHLSPVSVSIASTPQGKYEAKMYYIDLHLPNGFIFRGLLVMEGQPSGCDMLIGMDVIGKGDFAVSNYNGKTVFSYRQPSIGSIDFVNKSYLTPTVIKTDANSPAKNSSCPCGSGKKYKQCCGKQYFSQS